MNTLELKSRLDAAYSDIGIWRAENTLLVNEVKRLEELAQGRRELLDYDDKRILELSTENKELKEQCARLQQEYIRMFNQLYKED